MLESPTNALHLLVISGDAVVFEGEVTSVTSKNRKGEFDILDQHTNFISLIDEALTYKQFGGVSQTITFDRAVMQVYKNEVRVFVGLGAFRQVEKSKAISNKGEAVVL